MTRIWKSMAGLLLVLALSVAFVPRVQAQDFVTQFNAPRLYQVTPGTTRIIMMIPPSGSNQSSIAAKIEQLSSNGKVIGNAYLYQNGTEYLSGTLNGSSMTQTAGASYFTPNFSLILKLNAADTTSPISIRVTFYNGSVTP